MGGADIDALQVEHPEDVMWDDGGDAPVISMGDETTGQTVIDEARALRSKATGFVHFLLRMGIFQEHYCPVAKVWKDDLDEYRIQFGLLNLPR